MGQKRKTRLPRQFGSIRKISLATVEEPAPFARLRGEHRVQLLVKARSRKLMRAVIDAGMKAFETAGHDLRSVTLEVDPVSMM